MQKRYIYIYGTCLILILFRGVIMRLLLTFISIIFLLLAITSFITALWSLKEPLTCFFEIKFPAPKSTLRYKTAIGTVTDVKTSSSSSRSLRDGQSYTTGSTKVTIQFHDEKGHLYQVSCNPIFKNFKEKSFVNVLYSSDSFDEKWADDNKKHALENNSDIVSAADVNGIPLSIFLWLERPVIFVVIGIVLLILRFPVGQFKNMYP